MARILVIETDARQASLVKAIVLNHVGAQLEIVRSKDQAIAAIDAAVPDLLLLSALISPRDEQEVMAHLRALDRADHLQTLTIPRIASSSDDEDADGGLLSKFKRRRGGKPRASGCDPKVFAEEILGYLGRAEQIKADHFAVAEAARLAAEAEADRLRAASTILESPAPAPASIDVAPAAMEMPVVDAPAPEAETTAPAVVEATPIAESIPEPPLVEAWTPEIETSALVLVDAPLVAESTPEPPVMEAPTPEVETIVPAVVDAPLVAESIPEPPAMEAPTEIQLVAVPDQEPPAPDAFITESPAEGPPVVHPSPADTATAEASIAAARLRLWPHPDDAPISAVPWNDQTPVAEDLRALLHGLRLPAPLADLARAGGCRIHRVRVAQLPGPATISDRRGDADDLAVEPHAAWLDSRRGTSVASPQPRTPAHSH